MSYTEGFKARMIERVTGPERISAYALSKDVGVSAPTLYRWIREGSLAGMSDKSKKRNQGSRSAAEKLRIVREASLLTDEELGEFLRREGIHSAQLDEWVELVNAAALASLTSTKRSRTKKSPEQKQIQELKRDLRRKDKALAEATAILILKKKVREIWGDGDDDTDPKSDS